MTWSLIAAWLIAHGLEFAAVVTTIIGIWLTTRRLLICWPIILLADFLYLVVFFRSGFLSDALLQIFFVVFTIYGWWHWWSRSAGEPASWLLLWALSAVCFWAV
jgi:nicotinamide mononucleotide transporter